MGNDIYSLPHTLHFLPILDKNRFRVLRCQACELGASFAIPVDRLRLCCAAILPVYHSFRKTRISLSVHVSVRVYVCPQNTSNFVSRTPPTVLLQMYSNLAHTVKPMLKTTCIKRPPALKTTVLIEQAFQIQHNRTCI